MPPPAPVSCTLTQDPGAVETAQNGRPAVAQRPDSFGRFGRFGGKYVPETLMHALTGLGAHLPLFPFPSPRGTLASPPSPPPPPSPTKSSSRLATSEVTEGFWGDDDDGSGGGGGHRQPRRCPTVAARRSLRASLDKSRALSAPLARAGPRLDEIQQRLPTLEATVRPIRAHRLLCDHSTPLPMPSSSTTADDGGGVAIAPSPLPFPVIHKLLAILERMIARGSGRAGPGQREARARPDLFRA